MTSLLLRVCSRLAVHEAGKLPEVHLNGTMQHGSWDDPIPKCSGSLSAQQSQCGCKTSLVCTDRAGLQVQHRILDFVTSLEW